MLYDLEVSVLGHNLEVLEGDELEGTAPLDIAFSGTNDPFLWEVCIFILGDSETDCWGDDNLVALPTWFL